MSRKVISCFLALLMLLSFEIQTAFGAPNKASDTKFSCTEREDALGLKSILCIKLSLESDSKGRSGMLTIVCSTAGDGGRYVLTGINGYKSGQAIKLSADQGKLLVRIDNKPIEKWEFVAPANNGVLLLVPPGGNKKFSGKTLSNNSAKFFSLTKNSQKFAVRAYYADEPGEMSGAFSTNDFFSTWLKVGKICKN